MANDPYAVLGLSHGASADEVKAAYRRLAKKYHPDLNPGNREAERKMKEINEAYDLIVSGKYDPNAQQSAYSAYGARQGAGAYGAYGRTYADPFSGFSWGPFTGAYSAREDSVEMRAVLNSINAGRYAEALTLLSRINGRDAYWFYLSAIANDALGNRLNALDHAKKAAAMEPDNMEYVNLANRLEYANGAGGSYDRRFVMPNRGLSGLLGLFFCLFCGRGVFCC